MWANEEQSSADPVWIWHTERRDKSGILSHEQMCIVPFSFFSFEIMGVRGG